MNEVRTTQLVNQVAARVTSSKGALDAQPPQEDIESGKSLPEKAVEAEVKEKSQASKPREVDLSFALESMNDYLQSIKRDLHFTVDEDLKQTVVKVVESDSGDVIRQIPEDIFLELARRLKEDGEFRLLNAHG